MIWGQLSDCYDASNWIVTTVSTNGSVTNDGSTIIITGDTDGTGTGLDEIDCSVTDGNVTYCITVPSSGDITFDWAGPGGFTFNPFVEKFGYCLNGVATELTSLDPPPFGTSSGTATITVQAGDELCFVAASKFSDGLNSAPYTLNNFTLPACPPPPLSDCYEASNWTATTASTNGSVTNDGETIIITGDTDGTGTGLDEIDCSATDGNVTYCITVPSSGDITFDWAGPGGFTFNPFVEKFGYCLNGVATELTSLDPPPFGTSSGTATITVQAGDELCFIAASKFSDGLNSAPYTLNNFILPACPPPPPPTLSDCYDPANWINTTTNTSGSVTNDGEIIVMNGDKDGTGTGLDVLDCAATDGNVTTCIIVPASGEISFDWSGQSGPFFNPFVEKFGYCLNGVATELTSLDPPPFGTSSGSATITVQAGDELCLIYASKWADNPIYQPYTITNFVVPTCPEPPFSDCYDPSNWTATTANTNGSVSNDGETIIITGDTDGVGTGIDEIDCSATDGNVTYCITVPNSGDITFDWEGPGGFTFNPFVEKFGYCLNGVATELTSLDPPPFGTSSGTATIAVQAGDELCFIAASKFSDGLNSAPYTLSNFILPSCPLPTFSDCYDESNWSATTANTNGSVSNDGETIIITGDTDGTGTGIDEIDCSATDGNVTYCITVPNSGDITFDWEGPGGFTFNPFVEKFGYCLNGIATELTSLDPPPFGTSSGTATITVQAGDELCFIAASKFSDGLNSAPYTLSNFILPACPVPPLSECYDPANWTNNTANTSGSVSNDGETIVLNGDKDGTGTGLDVLDCAATDGNVTTCITIPASGEVSFDWSGQSGPFFNPFVEKFGYCLNGVATELTSLDPPPFGTSSGSATITVAAGDELCFIYASKFADNPIYEPYTLTNFTVTPCEEVFSISIAATPDTLACFGDANGSILVTPAAGTPDYTYTWDNAAATGNNPMNLAAGTYCVTVTDGMGETTSACIEIAEPTELAVTATADADVNCNGEADGQATATAAGGTMGYTYIWSNGETTAMAVSLSGGTHTVTVTDANGCETTTTVDISEPDALTITMSSTVELDMNADGTATATVGGGTAGYTYEWDTNPVQTTETVTGLSMGTYNVTVTDANGCEITGTVDVDQMTGVEEFSEITNINLFPNPSSGKVFLEMDLNQNLDISIQLFNSLGQEMSILKLNNVKTVREIFELEKLPAGMYWLSISSNEKKIVRKIVLD